MGADSPTEGPLNPWKGKQWRSWLLARGGPWQAVTRLLAAGPGPNGPAPTHSPELHLDGRATFGSLWATDGGHTHRRSVFRGMFLGMACSPVP